MRASRETELAAEHPIHVVCAWIGNSQAIAARHYPQVTDEDFREAGQNPGQQAAAEGRNCSHDESAACEKALVFEGLREGAGICDIKEYARRDSNPRPQVVPHKGLEESLPKGAAESGAASADPVMQTVMAAWPALSARVRTAILALLREAR
jgi:hypothetical protein